MENTFYPVSKSYRIKVTLKEEQIDGNGNYTLTCRNPNGNIGPYLVPVKQLCFYAFDFKEMKTFINTLVEQQIEKVEIEFK